MKDDFVAELGYLALAVRMKRLTESIVHSGRQLYRSLDLDIEPNWYLIFLLLQKYEMLSVTEIAEYLRFKHPSVISIIKKMKEKGYLESQVDQKDSRRQLIYLSAKAKDQLPQLNKVWEAAEEGIRGAFQEEDDFLERLTYIEKQVAVLDFMERTLIRLNNEQ